MSARRVNNHLWLLALTLFAAAGWAQNDCGIALTDAGKRYEFGNFDQVAALLEPCLSESGTTRREKVEAYRLLAMTYIATDHYGQAEDTVIELLALNANFEATLRDPPQFVKMVGEAKRRASSNQVTSVSKNSENLLEAPATVILLTEEDIRQRGYLDLEALLHDLPGFDISRGNGVHYSNIYQRGYRSNGNDRTLFLFDGVEENDLWTNFAYISKQYPLSNIKRVEIIYGPGSTMYGPNAYAGVINVITKDAEEIIQKGRKFGLRLQGNSGSWNTRYFDFAAASQHKNISFSLNGRVFNSDEMDLSEYPDWDYKVHDLEFYREKLAIRGVDREGGQWAQRFLEENDREPEHTYYRAVFDDQGQAIAIEVTEEGARRAASFDQAALGTVLEDHPITFSNHTRDWSLYGKLRVGELTLGAQAWRRAEGTIGWFTDDREGTSRNGGVWIPRHAFLYMKYDKSINEDLQLTFFNRFKSHSLDEENKILIFRSYAGENRRNLGELVQDIPSDWAEIYFYRLSKELRSELKLLYSPSEKFKLVSGVELRNGLIQVNYVTAFRSPHAAETGTPNLTDGVDGDNHHNQRDLGLYTQASYKAREQLRLTLGGRVDNNQVRDTEGYGTVFNSRAAVVYTPRDFAFKVIYSEAFKAASNWAKFSTSPSRDLNNPALDPEKVRNVDLSLSWQPRAGLFFDIVGYWARYSDVIGTAKVALPDGAETTRHEPLGKLGIRGVQVSGNWRRGEYTLFGNYTYTDAANVEDAWGRSIDVPIGDIARHRFNVGVNATFVRQFNLNLRLNRVGKRRTGKSTTVEDNPFDAIDSYTTINGALTYEVPLENLDLQLIFSNLLNAEYFHPGVRSADGKILAARLPQNERSIMLRALFAF